MVTLDYVSRHITIVESIVVFVHVRACITRKFDFLVLDVRVCTSRESDMYKNECNVANGIMFYCEHWRVSPASVQRKDSP